MFDPYDHLQFDGHPLGGVTVVLKSPENLTASQIMAIQRAYDETLRQCNLKFKDHRAKIKQGSDILNHYLK